MYIIEYFQAEENHDNATVMVKMNSGSSYHTHNAFTLTFEYKVHILAILHHTCTHAYQTFIIHHYIHVTFHKLTLTCIYKTFVPCMPLGYTQNKTVQV